MFRKLNISELQKTSVTITIDDVAVNAAEGETIAAVLLRVSPFTARVSPVSGTERAPFCMMGACFECLVEIDGKTSTRSCMTLVRDGMVVHRQGGRPDPSGQLSA